MCIRGGWRRGIFPWAHSQKTLRTPGWGRGGQEDGLAVE